MVNTKVKVFKDSVHGYIDVPVEFVKWLIDNEYFQRLRNIEQTGIRVLYPAAKHDRFIHSLGVFHLGRKAVEALKKDFGRKGLPESDFERCEVLFLAACLLHDIGHTPFSHSLEEQVLEKSAIAVKRNRRVKHETGISVGERLKRLMNEKETAYCEEHGIVRREITEINAAPHEQLGSYLIFDKFESNIENLERGCGIRTGGKYDLDDDICFIVRMITGIKYTECSKERQIRNCFIELLNGDNFDVDKLDYIMRDTQMSGINNISVDAERLLGALCVVTNTKHMNKSGLQIVGRENFTVSKLENKKDGRNRRMLYVSGRFKRALRISRGSELEIKAGSLIETLRGAEHELALVSYPTYDQAVFSAATYLKQDNEWVNAKEMSGFDEPVKLLSGVPNNKSFEAYFRCAELKKDLKIRAESDLTLNVHGECSLCIKGGFAAAGAVRVFSLVELKGDISEVEILGNTLSADCTENPAGSANDYNTYSIGFKKQAVNVIANVLEARNYLYLWVYAHHKVIYYANFLIPVISKEVAQRCGSTQGVFPSWKLNYDSLLNLDDCYIWTAIRYLYSNMIRKRNNEYVELIKQLFSRSYNKSLYKSLAEFELVFDSFTAEQKEYALKKLRSDTDSAKPYLGAKRQKGYIAGYLRKDALDRINEIIRGIAVVEDGAAEERKADCGGLRQLIYVVTEFKQKTLNPHKVYLDMADEILPISQIPLLSEKYTEHKSAKDKYFYLYYKENACDGALVDTKILKQAVKLYLSES